MLASNFLYSKTKFSFSEVSIESGKIDLRLARFSKCDFDHCEIAGASTSVLRRNEFRSCDFSGAEIDRGVAFPDLRVNGNYYFAENPPIGWVRKGWESVLGIVMPIPEPDDEGEDEIAP